MAQHARRGHPPEQQKPSSRRGEPRKPSPARAERGHATRDEERRDLDQLRGELGTPRDESRLG